LELTSGLHFANPIPAEEAIPKDENDALVEEAIRQADAAGSTGKDNTPFILNKIKELSRGRSVQANRVLIASNVKRGTLVAEELTKLEAEDRDNRG
jgi:pseudouridine-5'-phosphate glycosidase/pseudouridine kinase